MVWKKDQTVNWSPLPVLQSTENSEKKWGRNSKRFLMAELWLRHTGSVTTTSQSLKHTPARLMWMTELQEAAGACSGDQQSPPILTPDLRAQTRGSTSRNNCISQILPGATPHAGFSQKCSHSQNKSSHSSGSPGGDWASLPSGQQAGAYQLPFHIRFYFLSLLLTADRKQSPLS